MSASVPKVNLTAGFKGILRREELRLYNTAGGFLHAPAAVKGCTGAENLQLRNTSAPEDTFRRIASSRHARL